MDFKGVTESKNYYNDLDRGPKVLDTLLRFLDPYQRLADAPQVPQEKDFYGNWLKEHFDHLSPDDLHLMQTRGMTLQDIALMRLMQRGYDSRDGSVADFYNKSPHSLPRKIVP